MNIIKWIKNKWWWLPYYKKENLGEYESLKGRCLNCYASNLNKEFIDGLPSCGYGNNCPCKMNQRLKLRNKYIKK